MLSNDDRAATATQPRRRRPGRRLAGGLLSVAAAAGVAAGLLVAGSGSAALTRTTRPGDPQVAAAVSPWSAARAQAGMPRYYVLGAESKSGAGSLQVRASATGRVVSTVAGAAACNPETFQLATADDRSFVVGCDTPHSKSASIAFYRFRITSHGRASGLTPLAIRTSAAGLDAVSLTPDGRRLAIAMQGFGAVPGGPGAVEVVTLATGVTRTWTGSTPYSLTWTDNGRAIGLFENSGLYELNASTAGNKLSSARLVLPRTYGKDGLETAELSPDGRTIIASVVYDRGNQPLHRGTVVGGIVEFSATTKKALRTPVTIHAQYSVDGGGNEAGWYQAPCGLGPVDATGNHVLASCDQFGRADRGLFTALPGVGGATYFNAAW
jgi:hypothetical protein